MTAVNGPIIIEEVRYLRDAANREQGVLVMTTAGGEEFGAPMSVSQLRGLIEKLRQDLSAT